jgi:TonB-linked SusC/RagA family outer membrane protein
MACAAALVLACVAQASAQTTGEITGTVVDLATGAPLAGAQISVTGTSLGAAVGQNGTFTLANVPAGRHVVRAQRIGYGPTEDTVQVSAGQSVTVNFKLQPQAVSLQEMVVVGYGEQQREDITGAVASVTSDQFTEGPAKDAASLIAGKVPGLSVTTSSGDPTQGTEINLRGVTTISGPRNPLILIDGVPGDLQTVAPQDIASIDVLKDGSAAAIYGSRASNGVILITTKKYKGGAPSIRYNAYASYQTLYKQPDFLTAGDYRRLIGDGYSFEDLGYSTDWQNQVLRNPMSWTQNVSVAGGAENTNYLGSLTYENNEGIFKRSNDKKLTGRINVGHTMFDGKLHADLNLLNRVENSFFGPDFNYAWRQTLIRNPTDRVMDENGNWQERGTYFYTNPLGLINEQNGEAETRNLRMHGTLTLKPVDHLSLSLMAGTERETTQRGTATTFRHVNTTQSGQNGTAYRDDSSNVDKTLEFTGTYNNAFADDHDVTLLGGYSYQEVVDDGFWASNYDFPTDLFGDNQLGSGNALSEGKAGMGSDKSSYKVIGFFSRLNYSWRNRFLLMGSVRYEGNSRFGADHKWGVFPAISAGWRLSEEGFLKDHKNINDLKLRAGWGVTGIAPRNSYLSLTSYEYGDKFLYDGTWVQGLSPSRNPNPDLRWERKDEINLGLDYSLFNYRLSGSVDVYRRDTKDMLYNYSVPVPPYLYGNMLANVGQMRNEGIEASLTYDVIRRPDFRWTTSANWSTNRNKLVKLSNDVFQAGDWFTAGYTGEPIQLSTHRVDVGGPIGNFYGFESVDIDDDGKWIVLDSAGNRISIDDVNENDRRILGNGLPKHYVGWNNTVQWKGFDLNVNMRGAFGFQILNFQRMFYENPTILQYNMLESAFDPVYGKRTVNYDLAYVSYYIENGDYWKIDNVTLGYTFDQNQLPLVSNVVSSARLYVSGRNLLTLTGYKGLDPEVTTRGQDGLSPGNDYRDKYPTTRTFTLGLNVTF